MEGRPRGLFSKLAKSKMPPVSLESEAPPPSKSSFGPPSPSFSKKAATRSPATKAAPVFSKKALTNDVPEAPPAPPSKLAPAPPPPPAPPSTYQGKAALSPETSAFLFDQQPQKRAQKPNFWTSSAKEELAERAHQKQIEFEYAWDMGINQLFVDFSTDGKSVTLRNDGNVAGRLSNPKTSFVTAWSKHRFTKNQEAFFLRFSRIGRGSTIYFGIVGSAPNSEQNLKEFPLAFLYGTSGVLHCGGKLASTGVAPIIGGEAVTLAIDKSRGMMVIVREGTLLCMLPIKALPTTTHEWHVACQLENPFDSISMRPAELTDFIRNKLDSAMLELDLHAHASPITSLDPVVFGLALSLDVSENKLTSLPDDVSAQTALETLVAHNNQLTGISNELPMSLKTFDLHRNKIAQFPSVAGLASLTSLDLSFNPLSEVPDVSAFPPNLTSLWLRGCNLKSFPAHLLQLPKIATLDVSGHFFESSPQLPTQPSKSLTYLDVSGLPVLFECSSVSVVGLPASSQALVSANDGAVGVTSEEFERFIQLHPVLMYHQPPLNASEIFKMFDVNRNGLLEPAELSGLQAHLMSVMTKQDKTKQTFPLDLKSLFACAPNLKTLKLSNLSLCSLPPAISQLDKLETLDVSHNKLTELPIELGDCASLVDVSLRNNPPFNTPPQEVVGRGSFAVLSFLRGLKGGQQAVYRTKLMFVGLGGVGKTRLCKALTDRTYAERSTDGIDLEEWTVEVPQEDTTVPISFQLWDFAGQEVYYATHALFLSRRAIYLIVWNVRIGWEHSGVEYWLHSVKSHAPDACIVVVGTRVDEVPMGELPVDTLKAKFPQIKALVGVSSKTGEGIDHLRELVLELAANEPYMGERVPASWLDLRKNISRSAAQGVSYTAWPAFLDLCRDCAILDVETANRAAEFLHDVGSIIHYTDADAKDSGLSDLVVLAPQWLVDVCKTIVTAQATKIVGGILPHALLDDLWKDYPQDLHVKLLELMQKFELTYPVPAEDGGKSTQSLVPALLPKEPPSELNLHKLDLVDTCAMRYVWSFEFLPAGAFARTQVRLQQFVCAHSNWTHGCLLQKGTNPTNPNRVLLIHDAAQHHIRATAHGEDPTNLLGLVHAAIVSLRQSYRGFDFDVSIPCNVCLTKQLGHPHMFAMGLTVHRAQKLGVPFLQCQRFFHQIPVSSLVAELPPTTTEDHRVRMAANLQLLKMLKAGAKTPFFASWERTLGKDQPNYLTRLKNDLNTHNVGLHIPGANEALDEAAMHTSCGVLVLLTDAFVASKECVAEVYYLMRTLNKPCIPVCCSGLTGDEWRTTTLGLLVNELLYVDIRTEPLFAANVPALAQRMIQYVSDATTGSSANAVMLSYSWANSQKARKERGAIGETDPRDIKASLENQGLTTWIDIENLGYGGKEGLFEGINQGLSKSKVVVACVSNEYAASENCRMELRHALKALKRPVIVALVGEYEQRARWEDSEVGLLIGSSPFYDAPCPVVDFRRLASIANQIPPAEVFAQRMQELVGHVQQALELCQSAPTALSNQATLPSDVQEKSRVPRSVLEETAESVRRAFLSSLGVLRSSEDFPRLIVLVPGGLRLLCESPAGFHLVEGSLFAVGSNSLQLLVKEKSVRAYLQDLFDVLSATDEAVVWELQKQYGFEPMICFTQVAGQSPPHTQPEEALKGLRLLREVVSRERQLKRRSSTANITEECSALSSVVYSVLPNKDRFFLCSATHAKSHA